jgi:pimeloyl-ACP methyl ester carboxylesterase
MESAQHTATVSGHLGSIFRDIFKANGATIVAAHSYGGHIMTALGTDAPNVVGLVYVAAFGLDKGESIDRGFAFAGTSTAAMAHLFVDKGAFARIPEDDS